MSSPILGLITSLTLPDEDDRPPVHQEAQQEVMDMATRRIECLEELGQLKSYRAAA